MKKINYCFIALLLGFTLLSCQSTKSVNNSNNNNNNESYNYEIKYENPTKVDELFIEDVEEAYSFQIYRRNLTRGEKFIFNKSYIEPIGWSYKHYKGSVITDYFVNPGESYQYIIRYQTQDGVIVKESNIYIPYTNGYGEAKYETMPSASYNEKNGEFTFINFPEFSPSIEQLFSDKKIRYFGVLEYVGNDGYIGLDIDKHTKTIDLTTLIKDDKIYNKELNCNCIYSHIEDGDLIFSIPPVTKEQLTSLPSTVNVPNSALTLQADATSSCIILTLPPAPEGATRYTVSRKDLDKTALENRGDQESLYTCSNDLSQNVIKDYFVEKGKRYEYVVSFRRDEPDYSGILVKKTTPLVIKAIGGAGDLIPNEKPKASYNENTGILTFKKPFTLNKGLTEFIENNNGTIDLSRIIYTNTKGMSLQIDVTNTPITQIDCKTLVTEKGLDTTFELPNFVIRATIDGFTFYKSLWGQCMPDLPQKIYVAK